MVASYLRWKWRFTCSSIATVASLRVDPVRHRHDGAILGHDGIEHPVGLRADVLQIRQHAARHEDDLAAVTRPPLCHVGIERHDPHRRANTPLGMWAWLWQRISALLIWALFYLGPAGPGVRPVLAASLALMAAVTPEARSSFVPE